MTIPTSPIPTSPIPTSLFRPLVPLRVAARHWPRLATRKLLALGPVSFCRHLELDESWCLVVDACTEEPAPVLEVMGRRNAWALGLRAARLYLGVELRPELDSLAPADRGLAHLALADDGAELSSATEQPRRAVDVRIGPATEAPRAGDAASIRLLAELGPEANVRLQAERGR